METLYRKVAVSERLPPPMTDVLIKYRWNGYFEPYHYFDDLHCKDEFLKDVIFWIEEIQYPTVQLKADNEKLLEALENLTEYGSTGEDAVEMKREIESLIQKHKQ